MTSLPPSPDPQELRAIARGTKNKKLREALDAKADVMEMLADPDRVRFPEPPVIDVDPETEAEMDKQVERAGGSETWAAATMSSNGNKGNGSQEAEAGGKSTAPTKVSADELLKFADILVKEQTLELFRDPDGDVFGTLWPRCAAGDVDEAERGGRTFPIDSRNCRDFRRRFQGLFGDQDRSRPGRRRSIPAQAWSDAQGSLEATAVHDGKCRDVHLRVAAFEGRAIIDLGDDTGAAVEVTADGWSVIHDSPVRFRRPGAMRPLPRPEPGGSLELLRGYLHVVEEALPLVLSFLLNALAGRQPYPILDFHGEQDSSKSTVTRFCKQIVDDTKSPTRSLPKDEGELAIAAENSYVLAFGNLSNIPAWASDALCRTSDGDGLGKRALYENRGEVVFEGARPIILNGIAEAPRRPDLLDRTYLVECRPLDDAERRERNELWAAFERDRPAILGFLLDAVATAFAHLPDVHLERLPRMADAARFAIAAEPALGLVPGTMLAAIELSRDSATAVAFETSAVAQAVVAFYDDEGPWQGPLSELLEQLTRRFGDKKLPTSWPSSARGLSGELTRLSPVLRARGVPVSQVGGSGRNRRHWTIGSFSATEASS
jgi:hypothetical protein